MGGVIVWVGACYPMGANTVDKGDTLTRVRECYKCYTPTRVRECHKYHTPTRVRATIPLGRATTAQDARQVGGWCDCMGRLH